MPSNVSWFKVSFVCGLAFCCGCAGPFNRTLTGITVSPAAVQDNGSVAGVQFVATGTFSAPPTMLAPLAVNWSFSGFTTIPVPTEVTIDNSGLAHCVGFKGTVVVIAVHPTDPNTPAPAVVGPGTGMGFVGGSGTLTCQ